MDLDQIDPVRVKWRVMMIKNCCQLCYKTIDDGFSEKRYMEKGNMCSRCNNRADLVVKKLLARETSDDELQRTIQANLERRVGFIEQIVIKVIPMEVAAQMVSPHHLSPAVFV